MLNEVDLDIVPEGGQHVHGQWVKDGHPTQVAWAELESRGIKETIKNDGLDRGTGGWVDTHLLLGEIGDNEQGEKDSRSDSRRVVKNHVSAEAGGVVE